MTRKLLCKYDGSPADDGTTVLNAYAVRPDEVTDGDIYGYKIIAVVAPMFNGWCAYRGSTKWTDEEVAKWGDELSEQVARLLFPALAKARRLYGGW